MGLRSKFLFILIIFTVIPLVSYFILNHTLLKRFSGDLFEIATVLLLQTTAKELQDASDNTARNLNREFQGIDRLGYRYRDDLQLALHLANVANNAGEPKNKIKILITQKLAHYHQEMNDLRSDLIALRFIAAEGSTYFYPDSKITRETIIVFTDKAKDTSGDHFWLLPDAHHEPVLPRLAVCLVLPVRDINGMTTGYLALDFDVLTTLENIQSASQWLPFMTSMVLMVEVSQESIHGIAHIIAARKSSAANSAWQARIDTLSFDSRWNKQVKSLFGGRQYGDAGYLSLPYENEPSLWTYSKTSIGLGVINILPEREAIYKIARHPGRFGRWLALDSLLIVSAGVMVLVVIVTYRSRRMLDPLFDLIAAFKSVSSGDFSTRLEFDSKDERQMIAESFNRMTEQLDDGMRMRQGLTVAHEVQHNFFPGRDQQIPGLEISARISYCEETGGDYIDIIPCDDGKVCVIVGDVTGHGVGAALLMATVRALIRSRYDVDSDLANVITTVNSQLTKDMGDSGRFVTLLIIEIHPSCGEMRWVRAGHDPAWLFSSVDGSIITLSSPGVALGVVDDFVYVERRQDKLQPGDVIFVGTDGIWETFDSDAHQYGKDRLERIVKENTHAPVAIIGDSVLADVNHFRGDHKQEDDISFIVLKILEQ